MRDLALGRKRIKKKDKKKKEVKAKEEEMRKQGQYISSGSSSSDTEETSDSPFQTPSSRGGELWRIAQKKPGKLAERSLAEMTRYLADRNEMGSSGPKWSGQKVMAYLSQVVLTTHPPAKIGLRSHRELVTLALAIDEVLAGNLKQGLDILIQRFKALEASFLEGAMAKHLEIIPPAAASLTSEQERANAAKLELQAAKLKNFQMKSQRGTK